METLLPDLSRNPYYIFAPAYNQQSAGNRALHLLCHWLNRNGERAFLAHSSYSPKLVTPDLLTPLLTGEILQHHQLQKKTPIVVYPEITSGNPMQSDCVVRYVLNTPGLLGGEKIYSPRELVFAYSQHLSDQCERCDGVLHMPVIDQSIFKPDPNAIRRGSVFYAAKYRDVHNQVPTGMPSGAIEITRGRHDSQKPHEIARLLQTCETFYCFENTAMAIEAVLCGTPAVFMPNAFLDKPIALDELGWDGYAWGSDPAEIDRARASVAKGQENYGRLISRFHQQLASFVSITQARAKNADSAQAVMGKAAEIPAIDDAKLQRDESVELLPEFSFPVLEASYNLNSREFAARIKKKSTWRFHEWFRIVRALNVVAVRSIFKIVKIGRGPEQQVSE